VLCPQISNLALAGVPAKQFKSLFLRISVQKEVFELPLQSNTGALMVQWHDTVAIDDLLVSSLKELRIDVHGFQLRPFKALRQPLIGSVVIDLGDIIRSSQRERALCPSTAGGTGAATGTAAATNALDSSQALAQMSLDQSHIMYALPAAMFASDPATAGGNGNSSSVAMQLCSHTAWYILEPSASYKAKMQSQGVTKGSKKADKSKLAPSSSQSAVGMSKPKGGGVSYIDSLAGMYAASKGPRPDTNMPQLRLQILVAKR
jgi:hypothetical protein